MIQLLYHPPVMKYGGKEFLLEYTASTWIGPVMKILPSGLTISMDLRWDS
jgi:hypothetical protein